MLFPSVGSEVFLEFVFVVVGELGLNIVPYTTEYTHDLAVRSGCLRGIRKWNMHSLTDLAGEIWAVPISFIAHRDDVVKRFTKELSDILRSTVGDIDANFFHSPDRIRIDPGCGRGASRINVEPRIPRL